MSLFTFRAVVIAVFILAAASLVQSQTQWRSWVSTSGNDSTNCIRTSPCRTFSAALTRTAANGEINCVDSGEYGAFTITKGITIDCSGTLAGMIISNSTGTGITVNASSGYVRLRGLSINGVRTGQNGIRISAAGRVTIEDTIIDGFSKNGIFVESSVNPTEVFISNCSIRNSNNGINIVPTGYVSMNVFDSQILGNSTAGIYAQSSTVFVTNCLIARNINGIQTGTSGIFNLSGNTISSNNTGLLVGGGGKIISYGNNALSNVTNGTPTSIVALQ